MKSISVFLRRVAFAVMAACLVLFFATKTFAQEQESEDGTVYFMANRASGNTVVVLHRTADGSLTRVQEVSTGGFGSGVIPGPPPLGGPNPLDSQDSLISVADGRLLLAVNAGSNEVSVLRATEDGLQLIDKVPSGGEYPISIAFHADLVYVLNARGEPNITGFFLDFAGRLHAIPYSTRTVGGSGSLPAQVAFNPDGDLLIVTERVTNLIDIFRVEEDGRVEQRTRIPSNNRTPFAIVFGRHHIVAISESNESTPRVVVPHGGSVSTYRITDEDTLEPISKAVADNQSGTCWIRFTPNGRFAYAANAGSGSLSSYMVSRSGELSLQAVQAADTGSPRSVPVDLAITRDGRFLYVVSSLIGTVKGFRIEKNGSLTPVASIDGFPISMQGIVAR